jgi:predicted MFS family arabinose efflux permease
MPIVMLLLFVLFFEISSGPITWLYMAEIMHDKSLGIAVVMNWVVNLGIAIGTPYLVKAVGDNNVGYIFIVLGVITLLGTLFISIFMKETRNKTP